MRRFVGAEMHFGGTQLIHDSSRQLPHPSYMSTEPVGSDGPLSEPTQLLYTQLLDQYEGRMDGASHKAHHLDLDMETQLVDDHNFVTFGQKEGLLSHSEDEALKETQLIHGEEAYSGSSSGRDGEGDSPFSPLNGSLRRKAPHWLSEFSNRDRRVKGMIGRAARETFPSSERFLGEAQILSEDENGGSVQTVGGSFPGARAGQPALHRTDGDGQHFLRDFDSNIRAYPRQREGGNWHEIGGQGDTCQMVDRGWESTVRALGLVDSDASTEDEPDDWKEGGADAGPSDADRTPLAQDVNSRSSMHVANIFCSQDLNKSPEPENPMDEWGDGVAVDKDFAGVDEGGSNADLFNRDQPADTQLLDQCTRIEPGVIEDLNEVSVNEPSVRSIGSIRTESLRAAALRTPSYRVPERTESDFESEEILLEGKPASKSPSHSAGDEPGISESPLTGRQTAHSPNEDGRRPREKDGRTVQFSRVEQDKWQAPSSVGELRVREIGAKRGEILAEKRLQPEREVTSNDNRAASLQGRTQIEKFGMKAMTETEKRQTKSRESSSPVEKRSERRSSFGSGVLSGGGDGSFPDLQSPGVDSQERALNVVDKLVWLNGIDLPTERAKGAKTPACGAITGKSILQSRLQVAEARAGKNDPLGVFDWVDSHNDVAGNLFGSGLDKGATKTQGPPSQSKQLNDGTKRLSAALEVFGGRNKRLDRVVGEDREMHQNPSISKKRALSPGSFGRNDRPAIPLVGKKQPSQQNGTGPKAESRQGIEGRASDKRPNLSDNKGLKFGSSRTVPGVGGKAGLSGRTSQAASMPSVMEGKHGREGLKSSSSIPQPITDPKRKSDTIKQLRGVDSPRPLKKGTSSDYRQFMLSNGGDATHMTSDDFGQQKLYNSNGQGNLGAGDSMRDEGPTKLHGQTIGSGIISDIEGKVERRKNHEKSIPELGGVEDSRVSRAVVRPLDQSSGPFQEKNVRNSEGDPAHLQSNLEKPAEQPNLNDEGAFPGRNASVSKLVVIRSPGKSGDDDDGIRDSSGQGGSSPSSGDTHPAEEQGNPDELIHTSTSSHVSSGDPESEFEKEREACPESESEKERDSYDPPRQLRSYADASVKEKCDGNAAMASDIVTLGVEVDEAGKGGEIFQVVQKGMRRGRTRTRFKADSGRRGGTVTPIDQKGKRRRVTWAGPLELESRQGGQGVDRRTRQNLRWRDRGSDDGDNHSPVHSSDQEDEEEEVEKEQQAVSRVRRLRSAENGSRKRTAESLEPITSRNNDLEKIKRRFKMSDSAVARLLGSDDEEEAEEDVEDEDEGVNDEAEEEEEDEEEDDEGDEEEEGAEPNDTMGVKVRSLRNIQPGLEENEAIAFPADFRRVSKGLRSVRNRSDYSIRKLRTYPGFDCNKVEKEEIIQSDETAIDGSAEGTSTIETHPSDNEVNTGRRRMRSIADVSSPYVPQTTGIPTVSRSLRRRRSGSTAKFLPAPKASTSDDDDDEAGSEPPSSVPPSPGTGRLRGRVGPRSVRKRKEQETEHVKAVAELSIRQSTPPDFGHPSSVRRRRRSGLTSVLLSHGLHPDTIKRQGKIVMRLGGRVVNSATECTHFVADKFVRTGNMLEAMASGKSVVAIEWLERSSLTNRFADEEDFILEDQKKEDELGFNMISTLSSARERGLLQDIRVYITPGTSPGPDSLTRIVKAAGGQVVDEYDGPAPNGVHDTGFCIVISSQEELDDCVPLLEQGAKVYTPELILSGVTCFYLDFSSNQLFKNFSIRRRRGSLARRTI